MNGIDLIHDFTQRLVFGALVRRATSYWTDRPNAKTTKQSLFGDLPLGQSAENLNQAVIDLVAPEWLGGKGQQRETVLTAVRNHLDVIGCDPNSLNSYRERWENLARNAYFRGSQDEKPQFTAVLNSTIAAAATQKSSIPQSQGPLTQPPKVGIWVADYRRAAALIQQWRGHSALVTTRAKLVQLIRPAEQHRRRCEQITTRAKSFSLRSDVSRVVGGLLFPGSEHLLQTAVGELDRCREYLAQIDAHGVLSLEAWEQCLRACNEVDQYLNHLDRTWIPAVLASFFARSQKCGILPSIKASPVNQNSELRSGHSSPGQASDMQPEIELINNLLDGLDEQAGRRAAAVDQSVWQDLEETVDCVLRIAGRDGCRAEFTRDDSDPNCVKLEISESVTAPQVVQTGWRIVSPKESQLVRVAIVRRPPRKLSLAVRLKEFESAAENSGEADDELIGLVKAIRASFSKHPTLESWRSENRSSDSDAVKSLWRLLLRLTCLQTSHEALSRCRETVIDAFQKTGYQLVSVDKTAIGSTTPVLIPASGNTSAEPIVAVDESGRYEVWPAFALQTPEGVMPFQARGILVPSSWLKNDPIIACFVSAQPLIDLLRNKDPNWAGWDRYFDEVIYLAYQPGTPLKSEHLTKSLVDLFQAVYERAFSKTLADALVRNAYRNWARGLYKALCGASADPPFFPRLDPVTLVPNILPDELLNPHFRSVTWIPSKEAAFGKPVRVIRFGKPAQVEMSAGNDIDEILLAWLNMPPVVPKSGLLSRETAEWLEDFHRNLLAPIAKGGSHPSLTSIITALSDDFGNDRGQARINEMVNACLRLPSDDETRTTLRMWIPQLEGLNALRLFPKVDWPTGRISWPSDAAVAAVEWQFDETVPVRELIGSEATFASSPAKAKGTFSLGERKPDTTLDIAAAFVETVSELITNFPKVNDAAKKLRHFCIAHHMTGTATGVVPLSESLLDSILETYELARGSSDASGKLRPALQLVRQFCAKFDLQILPTRFTIGVPFTQDDLETDERQSFSVAFGPGEPGEIIVKRLGLRNTTGLRHRDYSVYTSAGMAPAFYDELLDALKTSGNEQAAPLIKELSGWPEAQCDNRLEHAVVQQFYVNFWKLLGESAHERDPDGFARLEAILEKLLEDRFQIVPFYPERIQSFPDGWVRIDKRSPGSSGIVRKVYRPGLAGKDDSLKVQALVDLE